MARPRIHFSKSCEQCSAEFLPWNAAQRFCTRTCAGYARHKAAPARSLTCPTCRCDFQTTEWVQKYCSAECRARMNHAADRVRKYGIEPCQIARMRIEQDDRCKICGVQKSDETSRWEKLHVDHCHKTGIVRGLLCQHCNRMLGGAQDQPHVLEAAMRYLESNRG